MYDGGGTLPGIGGTFFGAGFPNTGISYIMVSRGNLDQAGGTFFSGPDLGTLGFLV